MTNDDFNKRILRLIPDDFMDYIVVVNNVINIENINDNDNHCNYATVTEDKGGLFALNIYNCKNKLIISSVCDCDESNKEDIDELFFSVFKLIGITL